MKKFISIFMCIAMTTAVYAEDYDYGKVSSSSFYFYDANMCGGDVSENSKETWRGDCHRLDMAVPLDSSHTDLSDSFINEHRAALDSDGDGKIDVSGGYHDAGDHVKFGLPEMYAAATLQWAKYEFGDTIKANGDMAHMDTILKGFTDYIKKCTIMENGKVIAFCTQVGEGQSDHDYWGAPENQTTERKVHFATNDSYATDVLSQAAAAMAADYVNTKNEESLTYAKAIYAFAKESNYGMCTDYSSSGGDFYRSTTCDDDIAMAEAWLYAATGEQGYLSDAQKRLEQGVYSAPYWIYSWDNTWLGSIAVLAEKTGNETYWNAVKQTLDNFKNNYNTSEGYACIDNWGSARYNANAQFVALVYAKHKNDTFYAQWAKGQMDYLLGDNSRNLCYVTGVSENSVKHPHHRAVSGFYDANDNSDHKYTLRGALVGGPDKNGNFEDRTGNYQYMEVAIDYNAGFVGACAGLDYFYGKAEESTTITTTESTTETTTVTTTESTTESTTVTKSESTTESTTATTENTTGITTDEPVLLYGDASNNGMLTSDDAAAVLAKTLNSAFQTEVEKNLPFAYAFEVLDVTDDNIISSNDAASILNKVLNSEFVFEAEKNKK